MMKNDQWQVTDYGVESIPSENTSTPPYDIEAKRLLETTKRGTETFYDWPVHMAEKSWVKIDLFIEAFRAALRIHIGKYGGTTDAGMLEASCAKARRIAQEER